MAVQGHVDMVTEAAPSAADHDFATTGVTLVLDGPVVRAAGTTLGADNGIGVAAALALLDAPASTPLPPLQCLFTVDEETGLTGAFGLDAAALGLTARACLNLDTEDWGEVFIGCAGGGDTVVTLPVARDAGAATDAATVRFAVGGLAGGHSGLAIGDGRGNALILAGRLAAAAVEAAPGARLISATGGDKRNAIPRECAIVAAVPTAQLAAALAAAEAEAAGMRTEYAVGAVGAVGDGEAALPRGAEPGLDAAAAVVDAASAPPLPPLPAASSAALLTLLITLPHGVVKMSGVVPGLVETSTNLASVRPASPSPPSAADAFTIQTSTRSSHGPALEAVRRSIRATAAAVGASATHEDAYPGWAPNPASPLLALTRSSIAAVLGRVPEAKCIHAGLECGILGEKTGGADMVSFGPTITGAHTPQEAVTVATVGPFWEALLGLLKALSEVKA